jgi:hypothetical protein
MIDPATGWFEVKDVPDYTAMSTQAAFDEVWLSRYPRPEVIGFDGDSEFKHVFEEMRKNYGMKKRVTTAYNPQANDIVERVHLVLADALRTFELQARELDINDPWSSFLASAAFAIRSTYHTTLGASPGQLVFGRDNNSQINSVTTTATKALTSPGVPRALTLVPVRPKHVAPVTSMTLGPCCPSQPVCH